MDQQKFVDALKVHAADAAVEGVLAQWTSPSGRSPDQTRLRQSAWFNGISHEDRHMVETLVAETARATLFGVMCILDGARVIETPAAAHLELTSIEDGQATLLASTDFQRRAVARTSLMSAMGGKKPQGPTR